jgi:acyl-homoserine-lactone acylase
MSRKYALSLAAGIAVLVLPGPVRGALGGEWEELARHVTIRRDRYGVPHILGESEEAAAFAHGYVTAEDHFELLARLLLRARGEQAASLGGDFVKQDVLVHHLGIRETAEQAFHRLPPLTQSILDGYAAGVNFYVRRHSRAEPWRTPITGVDILAHGRAVLVLDFALDRRVFTETPERSESGSNAWAVGRGRSASGRGILLANPHLNWTGSHVFQEVHLKVPGQLNISGATPVGLPFVGMGFNENLGWALTVNRLDADDLYELTLDPVDHDRYLYNGRTLDFRSREIKIGVKAPSGVEAHSVTVQWSHHGPVVRKAGHKAYALKSANLGIVDFVTQWNLMAKARTIAEFRAALGIQAMPIFNVVYADRLGNVFYLFNGRIPIRPAGFDWSGIVPGDTAATEWHAIHSLGDLPQLSNPRSGYVQNCNDPPWFANLGEPIGVQRFSEYISGDAIGLRAQSSLQMLEGDRTITLEEVKRYKFNEAMLLADRLKPDLLSLAQGRAADEEWSEALRVLRAWNNHAGAASRGAVLFATWAEQYMSSTKRVFQVPWNAAQPLATPRGIGDPDAAVTALGKAIGAMKKQYGSLSVEWGAVHRLRRGTLDLPLGGADGQYGSFRNIRFRSSPDGTRTAYGGDSYVLAVEFTDPPTAYSIVAYSGSSDPQSGHYQDQSALFARGMFKRAWFTEEDIASSLERAYRPGE